MKVASNILLKVAGFVSIGVAIILAIGGTVFAVISSEPCRPWLEELLTDGTLTTAFPGTVQEQVAAIQLMYLIAAIVCFVYAALSIVNVVVSFMGRNKQTKGAYIANIVVGFISSVIINAVGGIFGLIATNRSNE